ncbi:MAG TPA: DUF3175 domain-containing protein [Verrucomicrobiae bacterium]|nr:DUF3175 domain-containing protein [Verrucomicrobiae bacterium]
MFLRVCPIHPSAHPRVRSSAWEFTLPNANRAKKNRWVARVKTDSTHPPRGLFTKSAETIARNLASRKVSPMGPGSGMRMLTYFMNRAGRGLSLARRRELDKAKCLLSQRIQRRTRSDRAKRKKW